MWGAGGGGSGGAGSRGGCRGRRGEGGGTGEVEENLQRKRDMYLVVHVTCDGGGY